MTTQLRSLLAVKLRLRGWSRDEIRTVVWSRGFDGSGRYIRATTEGGGKRVTFYAEKVPSKFPLATAPAAG